LTGFALFFMIYVFRGYESRVNNLIFSKKLLSFNIEQGQKSPAAENDIVV